MLWSLLLWRTYIVYKKTTSSRMNSAISLNCLHTLSNYYNNWPTPFCSGETFTFLLECIAIYFMFNLMMFLCKMPTILSGPNVSIIYSSGTNHRALQHDDVIKWKHFRHNWPFVRVIHRSTVNSTHKGQWRGALMFSLICTWINGWINNREAGDLETPSRPLSWWDNGRR